METASRSSAYLIVNGCFHFPSATEFVLTEQTASRAVFDNPRHDYPKRIVYELSAEGVLTATVGYMKGGTPRRFEYTRESK